MQIFSKLLLPLFVILCALTAGADELTGHELRCVFVSDLGTGRVETVYTFMNPPGKVLIESQESGDDVTTYTLKGSILSIANPTEDGNFVYDLSNPQKISRRFKDCVFPGQGGGDSHAVCHIAIERCHLK